MTDKIEDLTHDFWTALDKSRTVMLARWVLTASRRGR